MANIANVKVKSGNLLELSGSSVSISGSGGVVLHTENGGIDANAGTGPITLDAGSISLNSADKVDITGSNGVNLVGDATVSQDLSVTGDITGSNLLLTGEIIAQKLSIVETTVSSSVLYSSGSTKFGNTPGDGPGAEDTHQFSGSLYITGSTVTLTGGSFSGNGSGLTNVNADTVTLADAGDADATYYVTLVDGATGTQAINSDAGLTYNPSSNSLTTSTFVGDLQGNADTVTDGAYLSAGQTFTGTNVFDDANNQFTGSFSGDGSNLTNLDAGDISQGTLAIARGGTNNTSFTDVDGSANGQAFVVAYSGSALNSVAITGSSAIAVGFDGTKITLDIGESAGLGTVTQVNSGNGLTGGPITSTGTLEVSASAGGGINVASTGISVDDSIVLTTTGAGPYNMAAAVSSSIGFSGSAGLFGNLTVGSISTAPLQVQGSSLRLSTIASSGTYNVDTTPENVIILAANGSTINLPASPADGQYYVVKSKDGNATGVTISGGTKNIDDHGTSFVMYGPYQSVTLVYDASPGEDKWLIL